MKAVCSWVLVSDDRLELADAVPAAATRETAETCRDAIPNTDTKLVTLTNPVTLWFVSDTAPVMPSAVTKL